MMAALVVDLDELARIPNEQVTDLEAMRHQMFRSFLAMFSLIFSIRSVEYYFRRYRFGGLPITMAEHLQNACEMYLDRIGQFRDRLKEALTTTVKLYPDCEIEPGKIIKAFDKAFAWDIRQRNRAHHHRRYEDQYIDQLSLLCNLEIASPQLKKLISSRGIHRKAVNVWVRKVRQSADALSELMEQISEMMLSRVDLPKD